MPLIFSMHHRENSIAYIYFAVVEERVTNKAIPCPYMVHNTSLGSYMCEQLKIMKVLFSNIRMQRT